LHTSDIERISVYSTLWRLCDSKYGFPFVVHEQGSFQKCLSEHRICIFREVYWKIAR